MKPGHGEVLIAEGDVDVPEEHEELVEAFREQLDAGMWAAVPRAPARRPPRGADGVELRRGPAGRRPRDLLPARRGRALAPHAPRPQRQRRSSSSCCCGRSAGRRLRAARALARRPRAHRGRRLRPGPRAPRRAARADAAALVRQRGGVGDVPRPRLHPGLGRARRGSATRSRRRRRAVRLPRLPAQADRRLPPADAAPAQRVLRRRSPTRRARTAPRACRTPTTCWRSGWR